MPTPAPAAVTAGMPVREVVDAHHHLWDLARNLYPWLTDKPNVGLDITPFAGDCHVDDDRRYAGEVTVDKTVHVQAGRDPADPVGEAIWLAEVAAQHGIPQAIVAHTGIVDGLAAIVPPAAADEVFVRNAIEWYRPDD